MQQKLCRQWISNGALPQYVPGDVGGDVEVEVVVVVAVGVGGEHDVEYPVPVQVADEVLQELTLFGAGVVVAGGMVKMLFVVGFHIHDGAVLKGEPANVDGGGPGMLAGQVAVAGAFVCFAAVAAFAPLFAVFCKGDGPPCGVVFDFGDALCPGPPGQLDEGHDESAVHDAPFVFFGPSAVDDNAFHRAIEEERGLHKRGGKFGGVGLNARFF